MTYDCRSCGACCVGDMDDGYGYGFATVSTDDVKRMSRAVRARLHRDRLTFPAWATEEGEGAEHQLSTPTIVTDEFGKSCAFLRGTPGRRVSCGIYETRPDVCRRYKPGGIGCRTARAELGLDV